MKAVAITVSLAPLFLISVPAPAKAQNHPFRFTVGNDQSQGSGYSDNGLLGSSGYYKVAGATRFGLSIDIARTASKQYAALLYTDLSDGIFNRLFSGYGLGVRAGITGDAKTGGRGIYGGIGGGFYNFGRQDAGSFKESKKLGLKLSLGYQTRGVVFVETGATLANIQGYVARPGIVLGIRL